MADIVADLLEECLRLAQNMLQFGELEEVAVESVGVRVDLVEFRLESLKRGLCAAATSISFDIRANNCRMRTH